MSKSVEERIVEMQFDNAQFESGIKTSIKSLDKLENKLQLKGAAKGLDDLNEAARDMDFGKLSYAVDAIASRFTNLGIVGMNVLSRITDSAINAGKKVISAFTVDPVKSGFQEYETQIDAIQTILANTKSKGSTLDDVNRALNDLNHYADMTIYNFTEMTRNIGRFTAAGVDLDTSTNAIKGIANLAAVSGSTSQQASMAMYQLSQALASGTVKLMDWNSVVNANMGGEMFQNALLETARAAKITIPKTIKEVNDSGKSISKSVNMTIDELIKSEGSFRETLSTGWLTADILNETLQKFTETTEGLTEAQIEQKREYWRNKGYTDQQIDDIFELGKTATDAATKVKTFTQLMDTLKEAAQSGWTQSWMTIIGDFEEAKELLTTLSDRFGKLIGDSAEARNKVLQDWANLGGRKILIQAFDVVFSIGRDLVTSIKTAFKQIFPSLTGKDLYELTNSLKQGLQAIYQFLWSPMGKNDNWPVIMYIQNAVRGLSGILGIAKEAILALFDGVGKVAQKCEPFLRFLIKSAGELGDWIYSVYQSVRANKTFTNAIEAVVGAFTSLFDLLVPIGQAIKTWLIDKLNMFVNSDFVHAIGEFFASFGAKIPSAIASLVAFGKAQAEMLRNSEFFKNALAKIQEFLQPVWQWIQGMVTKVGDGFKALLDADTSGITDFVSKVRARIAAFLSAVGAELSLDKIQEKWEQFKALFSKNKGTPIDLSGLSSFADKVRAVLKQVWDTIRSFDLKGSIATGFNNFISVLGSVIDKVFSLAGHIDLGMIDKIAKIIAILSGAGMMRGIGSAGKGVKNLLNTLSKGLANKFGLESAADGILEKLTSLAKALAMLAGSVWLLGTMSWDSMTKSLIGLMGVAFVLGLASQAIKNVDTKPFLALAGALALATIPLMILSSFNWGRLGKMAMILTGFSAIMGLANILFGAAAKIAGGPLKGFAATMLAFGATLNLVTLPMLILSAFPYETLGKCALVLGGFTLIMGLGAILIGVASRISGGNALRIGGTMLAFGTALNLMMIPVLLLSKIPDNELKRAMKSIALMGIVTLGMTAVLHALAGNDTGTAFRKALNMAIVMVPFLGYMFVITKMLEKVSRMDGDAMIDFAKTFGIISLALVGIAAVLGNLGLQTSAVAAGALVVLATGLAAAVAIFGGIVGGTLVSFSRDLTQIGPNLAFFSNTVSGINEGNIDKAVNTIEKVGKAFSGISNVATTKITAFTSSMTHIGAELYMFSELTKNVSGNLTALDAVVTWMRELPGQFAALTQNGGTVAISDAIIDLGASLSLWARMTASSESVAAPGAGTGASFAKWVEELAENMPDVGDVITITSFGEGQANDATQMAKGIEAVGAALKGYGDNIGGLDPDKIATANDALTRFASLHGQMNNLETIITGKVLGSSAGLGNFAANITELGVGLGAFIKAVNGIGVADNQKIEGAAISAEHMEAAITSLNRLAALDNVLGLGHNWLTDLIDVSGNENLAGFGAKLISLGEGLRVFIGSISSDNIGTPAQMKEKVDSVVAALTALKNAETSLGSDGNVVARLLGGQQTLTTFGEKLSSLGANIRAFMTAIAMDDPTRAAASQTMDTVQSLAGMSGELSSVFSAIGGAAREFDFGEQGYAFNAAISSIGGLIDALSKADGLDETNVSQLGSLLTATTESGVAASAGELATAFFTAFNSKFIEAVVISQTTAETRFGDLAAACARKVRGYRGQFEDAGFYLADGFAAGILSNQETVVNAAATVGAAAADALNTALKIASPSKVTAKSGFWFTKGFADGISDNATAAKNSAKRVADSAASAINQVPGMKTAWAGFKTDFVFSGGNKSQASSSTVKNASEKNNVLGTLGKTSSEMNGLLSSIRQNTEGMRKELKDAAIADKANIKNALSTVTDIVDAIPKNVQGYAKDIWDKFGGDLNAIRNAYGDRLDPTTANALVYYEMYGSFDEPVKKAGPSSLIPTPGKRQNSAGSEGISSGASGSGGAYSGGYSYEEASSIQSTIRDLTRIRDLFDAITSVSAKVASLGDAVTGMQIVMDSGVMVGQIETKIDKRLGSIAALKGRGV